MTFDDWAKTKLISKPGTVSYMEAKAAWKAACEACAQLCDEEASCEGIAQKCAAKIRAMVNEQS